jgi:hypothetical protein
MQLHPEPFRDILYRTAARYLTVRPEGFLVAAKPVPVLDARVLAFGPARTLYRGRKPVCRSLDAVQSIRGKRCSECPDLKHCTPQVRVDLLVGDRPWRMMLAFTSAKHFLLYAAELKIRGVAIETVTTRMTVIPRGSWGEVRFQRV